jgi:hypothetical protein
MLKSRLVAPTLSQWHGIHTALKMYTSTANYIVTAARELFGQFTQMNSLQLSGRFESSAVEA